MIDPALEQRLNSCRQLIKAWNQFHSYLTAAMKEGMQFDGKAENDFLGLKSQIAILHDTFHESVQKGSREAAATSQSVITIVERCVLLRQVSRMSVAELKRMEMEWHEAYLLINDTIGILEEQVAQLAEVSQMSYTVGLCGKKIKMWGQAIASNRNALGGVIMLVIVLALTILPIMGVFSYDFLDQQSWAKTPYRTTRSLFRATVMKELKYLDFAEYVVHGRGNIGFLFDPEDISDAQKEKVKKDSLKPFGETGENPSDFTENPNIVEVIVERYRTRDEAKPNRTVVNIVFLHFTEVEYAKAAEGKAFEELRKNKACRLGRRGNMIYWITMLQYRRGISEVERYFPLIDLDDVLKEGLSEKKDPE